MNIKIVMICILVLITIIGLMKKMYNIKKSVDNYNFIIDYFEKVDKLLNKNIDDEDYTYILNKINKVSNVMGNYGIIKNYKPPFANYYYTEYNIINIIVNYQSEIMDEELFLCLKMFQIYTGACNEKIEKLKNQLKNPLNLFAEGFRFVFNIPLFILNSLGIISDRIYYKVKGNIIYSFIQNIFGVIGFISSIIGIIQGKEVLFKIYNKISYLIASILK